MALKATAKKAADRPKGLGGALQSVQLRGRDTAECNGEIPYAPVVTKADISRVMAELGRRGGKIGGKVRAASMTAERRSEIALKAARARWLQK